MFEIIVKNTNTKETISKIVRGTLESAERMKNGFEEHYKEKGRNDIEIVIEDQTE